MFRLTLTRRMTVVVAAVLMGAASSVCAYYDSATGRTWRDLSESSLRGWTWGAIAAVCPSDGITPCNGSLTTDTRDDVFTGWIWGTRDQVNDLFKHVTGLGSALDNYYERELGLPFTWAPPAIAALGENRFFSDPRIGHDSMGWTSTSDDSLPNAAFMAVISTCDGTPSLELWCLVPAEQEGADPSDDAFQMALVGSFRKGLTSGAFLYRVPEPSTLALLGVGLAGLATSRRRRR